MSHFTVLVIGDNPEDLLAPFQENNMGDCPKELLEFNIEIPEDELKIEFTNWKKDHPEEADDYESIEEWVLEWHGYKLEEGKGAGYWENPNAKWDWFSLGGRWTGMFKLKEKVNSSPFGVQGNPGLMTKPAEEGWVDQALKRDIDFEAMVENKKQEARERYEKIEKAFPEGIPQIEVSWKECMDGEEYKDWDIEKKRDFYHNQKSLVESENIISKLRQENGWFDLEDYQCTKEEYIAAAGDAAVSTFAVIKDGEWYERGSMGWWAFVSDENDNWDEEFTKLLDSVSDETLLSVYDCHI